MKNESAKTQKKDVKPVVEVNRCARKRTTSKQAKVVTAVAEIPEIIEQPAEQQPAPQVVDAAGTDSAEITEQPSEPQTADTSTANSQGIESPPGYVKDVFPVGAWVFLSEMGKRKPPGS